MATLLQSIIGIDPKETVMYKSVTLAFNVNICSNRMVLVKNLDIENTNKLIRIQTLKIPVGS